MINNLSLFLKKTAHPTLDEKKWIYDYVQERKGWVYAARLDQVDCFKVGMTKKENPFMRVHELRAHVGAFLDFELQQAIQVVNRHEAEADIHQVLSKYHVKKEFFECPLSHISTAFNGYKEKERVLWVGWDVEGAIQGKGREIWCAHAFDWDIWWDYQQSNLPFD
jgi:hypothetical protein